MQLRKFFLAYGIHRSPTAQNALDVLRLRQGSECAAKERLEVYGSEFFSRQFPEEFKHKLVETFCSLACLEGIMKKAQKLAHDATGG